MTFLETLGTAAAIVVAFKVTCGVVAILCLGFAIKGGLANSGE